jgi:hypothetical protein
MVGFPSDYPHKDKHVEGDHIPPIRESIPTPHRGEKEHVVVQHNEPYTHE